jgi:F0F1-type ATP synthase membrane subunit c/vacuolar-type H+-ATPase subunit K
MFGVGDEKVRTTGTFSYPSGYTTFLTVMLYLGVGLAASKNWRFSGNLWPWTLVVVTVAAIFTTGSRAPIYLTVITAPVVLYIWSSRGIISIGNVVKVGIACICISIIVAFIAPEAIEAYQHRREHSEDTIVRMLSPLTEGYYALTESPIIGAGMASTHGSAVTIMGTMDYWWLDGIFVEQEGARVLQETGVIGFILVYVARTWLLVKAISLGRRFRTPLYAAMAGVIAGFFSQHWIGLNVINSPTAGIYYWFLGGLLFAMYRLELQEATASLPTAASRRQQLRRENGKRRAAPSYGVR